MASRTALDQEIFQAAFQRSASVYEIWLAISRQGYDLSYSDVEERVGDLRSLLSSRQLWLLSAARMPVEPLDSNVEDSAPRDVIDPAPDPETLAILSQNKATLGKALLRVDPSDRLLLRLRYVECLGLREVARLVGLKDAQTADRRIRDALDRLRGIVDEKMAVYGKRKSASV